MKTSHALGALLVMFVGSLLVAGYLLAQSLPMVQSVTLAWDASPSPSVTGYYIYYGPGSRSYTNKVYSGCCSCVVSNLTGGVTYYFAATASDTNGLESDYSNEVSYRVPSNWVDHPGSLIMMQTSTNDGTLLLESPGP